MVSRGAFIVLEGLDRSGKSTQVKKLLDSLHLKGIKAVEYRFPDRTTTIGKMINSYLTQTSELDDKSIHLLFSANRWEKSKSILKDLNEGTTVICDRYAFSGIAFTAIKEINYNWCKSPDVGLPSPDLILFLNLSPSEATKRGSYGEERYENPITQLKVKSLFYTIGEEKSLNGKWKVIDAGREREVVGDEIESIVSGVIGGPLGDVGKLWEEEEVV